MTDNHANPPNNSRMSPSLLFCLALLSAPLCHAQNDGTLDPGFGTSGIATTSLGPGYDVAFAIAIQDDEKIVATGLAGVSLNPFLNDFGLVRYNSDGTLDSGFGTNGIVVTPIGTGDDQARALAIQPDGKILVAGSARINNTWDVALVRYLPNGFLDNTFGNGGIVTRSVGQGDDLAFAMALQADGKIIVGGHSQIQSSIQMSVLRFNSNGSIDNGFAQNGQTVLNFGSSTALAYSFIVQPDQKILVGGYAGNSGERDFAIIRLLANGQLDTSFGTGGGTLTAVTSGDDLAYGMALQQNGKIVLCGKTSLGADEDIALVRYTPSGMLDGSFGSNGIVTLDGGFGDDVAWAVAVQPEERILITGALTTATSTQHMVMRLDSLGEMDPAFGSNGTVITTNPAGASYAHAIVLHPTGYFLTAGGTFNGQVVDFMVTKHVGQSLSVGLGSIDEPSLAPTVYPNPNQGDFTVQIGEGSFPQQFRVLNAMGQEVAAFNLGLGSPTMSLEHFNSGTYVLHWTSGSKQGSQRILVVR